MKVKIINKSSNPAPEYKTSGSAGMDISAWVEENITLIPGERMLINTGLYFEIPEGYEGQVRPRSGLAIKYGITVINSPGTIDSDYRGEIKVGLVNHSDEGFVIKSGDRIAQIIIAPVEKATLFTTEVIEKTDRGEGGFGSTGV